MTESTLEPWLVKSMRELIGLAWSMEQQAVTGYVALSERMRAENRPDLAAVFDTLIAEERGHLEKVDSWLSDLGDSRPQAPSPLPETLFDDEGAAVVAPELFSSYRAFSMAVRNEERAFVFWTYVAAHAPSDDIRLAAERMAKEELGHVATLRRERRRAFHEMRQRTAAAVRGDLAALEMRLADQLGRAANAPGAIDAGRLLSLGQEARQRAVLLSGTPFIATPLLENVPERVGEQAVPLCEFLLDCYLDLAEREKGEPARDRAQMFAAGLIQCLQVVRAIPPVGP